MITHDAKTSGGSGQAASNNMSKGGISLPPASVIQPKLTVNQPNDVYEQEADSIADQVISMKSAAIQAKPLSVSSLQRKCTPYEEDMQRKETNGQEATADSGLENYVRGLNSGGQALSDNVKSFYEPRFGYDFSNVKVHTDSVAAKSAQSVNALAYTNGNNIVFNREQYSPETDNGKRLLAHELTHVIQQNSSGVDLVNKSLQRHNIIQRVLAALDISTIADEVHEATDGLGTDEERIFVSLQRLNRDPADIQALINDYQARYHESLESVLRDEMSGSELQLALEEINIINPSGNLVNAAAPANSTEYNAAAQRLKSAMNGIGTDEETIYAVLLPFNRNPLTLAQLKTAYHTLTGNDLRADLESEMSSDELAYALYLLNAPPVETGTVSTPMTNSGSQVGSGTVTGGNIAVRTGDAATGVTPTGTFSMGYTGGSANDSRWLQFIWREVLVTHADGSTTALNDAIITSGGHYNLTTDPGHPNYNTDSAPGAGSPFYEAGFLNTRTADSTTMIDMPGSMDPLIQREFTAGATLVVSKAHFNTFLVRDYRPLYQTTLTVQWTYTSSAVPPRVQQLEESHNVDQLPEGMRARLIDQYPDYNYIL